MALITCPECSKQISEHALSCPNCGFQLTPEKIAEIKEKYKQSFNETIETAKHKKKELRPKKKANSGLVFGSVILVILALLFIYDKYSHYKSPDVLKFENDKRMADSIKFSEFQKLGIWDLIGNMYITTLAPVFGTFSNSASENALLRIEIIIDKVSVEIKLFEYDGTNPVKKGINDYYSVSVWSGLKCLYLKAENKRDRICFNEIDSQKLMEFLSKGGDLEFNISNYSRYISSDYHFILKDAGGFSYAYKKLIQSF